MFNGIYDFRLNRLNVMTGMGMVGIIHNRCLTIKDGVFDDSAAVTLMSNDADMVQYSADLVHELWAQILELFLGLYLLASQLGWACLVPILIVVGMSTPNGRMQILSKLRLTTLGRHFAGRQVCDRQHRRSPESLQYGNSDTHLDHQSHPGLDEEYQDDGPCRQNGGQDPSRSRQGDQSLHWLQLAHHRLQCER